MVSLHGMSAQLANCCAGAFGGSIVIYPMQGGPVGQLPPVKAMWSAHKGQITSMHRPSFGNSLYSGSRHGDVHRCGQLVFVLLFIVNDCLSE